MQKLKKWEVSKIIDLAKDNLSATEISKITGISFSLVYNICRRNGTVLSKEPRGGKNFKDLSGQTFHGMKVIDRNGSIGKLASWNCLCPCGNMFIAKGSEIRAGKIKTCGCRTGIQNKRNWSGFGEIPKKYWSNLVRNAEQRFIEFAISIEYLSDLYTKQNKKCSLSGENISFHDKTASLDRIDNSKGYLVGNVQWVHKTINKMKQTIDNEEFISWCRKVFNEHNRS